VSESLSAAWCVRILLRAGVAAVIALLLPLVSLAAERSHPNILLIVTDDQGHGDLGFHGNPKIKTPNLDAFAKQSIRLTNFYVSPVCSPTRSSLMTGRYNYRTGIVDTFLGRSMMHPDEVTLAEMLTATHRSGIFGKWHLGDNYPMRPIDQGFHEALVCRGGGIGQPSDPPGTPQDTSYFDPILQHNGKPEKTKGYCSDVFTDAAIKFIADNKDRPFFCYLAYNAPHGPFQVPESYLAPYKKMNLAHDQFPEVGQPLPGKANEDNIARVYGMVTNIDDNFGRLFAKLDELKLTDDTIVWFLTDNGPPFVRYNSGFRNLKGTAYEGGIHVPGFVRWPRALKGGWDLGTIAAHIDVAPTLLDVCGVSPPKDVKIDGKSLLPLLKQEKVDWPARMLYFQWHRGDVPELNRACAARSDRWKLVQPAGAGNMKPPEKPTFQLFEIGKDPFEQNDVAEKNPEVVAAMRKGYEAWFADVKKTRNFAPPRIHIGSPKENPTVLTRQDWRGPKAGWGPKDIGHWEIEAEADARYDVTLRFAAVTEETLIRLSLKDTPVSVRVAKGSTEVTLHDLEIKRGAAEIQAEIGEGKGVGPLYVELKRRE
jgi:arylsulfatase A-like enzyme